MSKQTITKETIIAAAEKLAAAGKPVTNAAVRDALGSGSLATISPVLKEWRAEVAKTEQVQLPDALQTAWLAAGKRFWAQAESMAAESFKATQSRLESESESLKAELTDALADNERLTAEVSNSVSVISKLEKRCDTAEKKTASLAASEAAAVAKAESLQTQLADTLRRHDALQEQLLKLAAGK